MQNPNICFIGAGHMARSIITGLIHNQYPADHITATNPHEDKLNALGDELGIHTTIDNVAGSQQANVVVLAIKPQHVQKVMAELQANITQHKPLIISLAVCISTDMIATWSEPSMAIVRCMPNTPATLGAGMSGLFANDNVSQAQKDTAESMMRAVGSAIWVEKEAHIDAVAALSGSGPAYCFLVMEALKHAGMKLGLSAEQAHMLTLQTTLGASRMAMECGGESLGELRRQVTSPGGTTEAAIKVLQDGKLETLFEEALQSAANRAQMLSENLSQKD
jgi:pyrroline-5-carboxylate reductase